MFQRGVAVLTSSLTGVILSDAEPAVTDRDKVWARTAAGFPVFPFLWKFQNGQWLSKHPIPAGTLWAYAYTGTVASVDTLDGGAAGAVSDNTGPFWEVIAAMAARSPIGAGTLPSGLILNVGDVGGEERHTLLTTELAKHTHQRNNDNNSEDIVLGSVNTGTTELFAGTISPFPGGHVAQYTNTGPNNGGGTDGEANPHNNLPPYYTLSFLRRTARVYATQPIA